MLTIADVNERAEAIKNYKEAVAEYQRMKAITFITFYFDGYPSMDSRNAEVLDAIKNLVINLHRTRIVDAYGKLEALGVSVSEDELSEAVA